MINRNLRAVRVSGSPFFDLLTMILLNYRIAPILFVCFVWAGSLLAQSEIRSRFLVDPVSRLHIHGQSNVNVFTCTCQQAFHPLPFQITGHKDRDKLGFRHTVLKVETRLFDCGNKVMNRDMYIALRANDYPEMSIELEAIEQNGPLPQTWQEMKVWTRITIAGVSQRVMLPARVRQPAEGRWQIKAKKELKMTDFKINPPTALMGMIKTYDEITIELDLLIHWLPQG
jgi:hypothetical protein